MRPECAEMSAEFKQREINLKNKLLKKKYQKTTREYGDLVFADFTYHQGLINSMLHINCRNTNS